MKGRNSCDEVSDFPAWGKIIVERVQANSSAMVLRLCVLSINAKHHLYSCLENTIFLWELCSMTFLLSHIFNTLEYSTINIK